MKRFRPSIAGLMALIFSLALAFAALRGGSALWASITYTCVVAILCLAPLGALYCRRPARIAWTGFAAFGWAYLSMTFGPWPNGNGVTAPPFPTMLAYEPLQRSRAPSLVSIDGTIYPGVEARESGPPAELLAIIHEGTIYHVPADQLPRGWTPVASGGRKPDGEVAALPANAAGFGFPAAPPQPPPPGQIAARPPVVDSLQLRRILHAIGAIAFAAIGAVAGRIFAACIEPARLATPPSDSAPA